MGAILKILGFLGWLWQRIAAKRDADAPAKAQAEADAAVNADDGGKSLEKMMQTDLHRK